MFSRKVTDSDDFLDLPPLSQILYFHLHMSADDDGFINAPKKTQKLLGASDKDMKRLTEKGFLIGFDNGIFVIRHWHMHNQIRKDRHHPTQYQNERALLVLSDEGVYETNTPTTKCQPKDNQMTTEYSIDKNSIDKNSIDKGSKDTKNKRFSPPTLEEIKAYCLERGNNVNAEKFVNHYTSNGWMVGKNKMKDWKSAVRTWEQNDYSNSAKSNPSPTNEQDNEWWNEATKIGGGD